MSNMTTILIQGLAGFMLLLFGAMALFPLFVSNKPSTRSIDSTAEDKVLNISPVPMIERFRPVPGHRSVLLGNTVLPAGEDHGRDAA